MATRNDITGDRLINTPKISPTGAVQEPRAFSFPSPEFKIYRCDTCNVKVSTSNDCCPCCGKKLT